MDDSPFGDDGFLHLEITIVMPRGMPSSRVVDELFRVRHRQSLEVKPPGNPSWHELERHFKPFVKKIRRTRREIERRYKVTLPPHCLLLRIRRGQDARGPIIAEINEGRMHVYRRA